MQVLSNYSLKGHNTFGIESKADTFVVFEDVSEIIEYLNSNDLSQKRHLILGEGSNILFTGDFAGTILKVNTSGVELVEEDEDKVLIRVQAGENWDKLVEESVDKGWGGLENLSLIPGNTGSSPIQNIGAYGVELKDHFHELEAINIFTGELMRFTKRDCRFGYRSSIFKQSARGRFIILAVSFLLDKKPQPVLSYLGVKEELETMRVATPGLQEMRQAIINIRNRKLPDPAVTGNAGSFFKNPVLLRKRYERLLNVFPDLPGFLVDERHVKVSAAWLIDHCGLKGTTLGDAGIHDKQPLVLVNMGKATGEEILQLSRKIQDSVLESYGIELEPEVTII